MGPYSQAVQVDKTLYISGSIGIDPKSGSFVGSTVSDQARQALKNIGEILKDANCSYRNVVKTTVFLQDMNDFSAMNEVYQEVFSERYPARSTVQVAALPKSAKVEIEAIAIVGDIQDE